jgi:hypothetical protein
MSPIVLITLAVLIGIGSFVLTVSIMKRYPDWRNRVAVLSLVVLALCFAIIGGTWGPTSLLILAAVFASLAIVSPRRPRVSSGS